MDFFFQVVHKNTTKMSYTKAFKNFYTSIPYQTLIKKKCILTSYDLLKRRFSSLVFVLGENMKDILMPIYLEG